MQYILHTALKQRFPYFHFQFGIPDQKRINRLVVFERRLKGQDGQKMSTYFKIPPRSCLPNFYLKSCPTFYIRVAKNWFYVATCKYLLCQLGKQNVTLFFLCFWYQTVKEQQKKYKNVFSFICLPFGRNQPT